VSDLVTTRHISSTELKQWRLKGRLASRRNPREHQYGVSRGSAQAAPVLQTQPGWDGGMDVEMPAKGKPLSARALVDKTLQRRLDQLARMQQLGIDAKLELVQTLRQTKPGLFGDIADDNEAIAKLNEILLAEAKQIAKNALVYHARDRTLIYGR